MVEMREGQSVRAGKVPEEVTDSVPRVQSHSIPPLAVSAEETRWFELRVDPEGTDRSDDDVFSKGVAEGVAN